MTATVETRAEPPAPQLRLQRLRRRHLTPWMMLAPGIVLFTVFMAAPILYTFVLSFQKEMVKGLGLGSGSRSRTFAGLENYVATLTDPEFLASVGRVLVYGLILVPTMLGLALLFALLLDARRTGAKGFSRVSIFLPYAVPAVISSLLWGFLYLPAVSPFYWIFEQLGWDDVPSLLSPGLVIFAIANIGLWGGVGFNMIVMYTSLKAVPTEIYEAARIDGASEVQIAWRIKVPIIMPALIMTALFSMIATLQVFAEPMTLRPLTNSLSTTWSPAHVRVPRRVHARRHLLGGRDLGDHRDRHVRAVLLLPPRRAATRIRPGGLSHDHDRPDPSPGAARARRGIRGPSPPSRTWRLRRCPPRPADAARRRHDGRAAPRRALLPAAGGVGRDRVDEGCLGALLDLHVRARRRTSGTTSSSSRTTATACTGAGC